MTSLWRFNLPREPLWQALDLFSRPPDGLPECSERLQTAVHMAISLTDASGPMLSVLRVTAGDHGRRQAKFYGLRKTLVNGHKVEICKCKGYKVDKEDSSSKYGRAKYVHSFEES